MSSLRVRSPVHCDEGLSQTRCVGSAPPMLDAEWRRREACRTCMFRVNTAGFNGFVVWQGMLEISDMLFTLDLRGIGLAELVGGAVIQGSGMHIILVYTYTYIYR